MTLITSDHFKDFNIVYQSPLLASPQEASYILLGENHSNLTMRQKNARLIDSCLTPDSILLVEGVRCATTVDQPLTDPARSSLFREFQISQYAQHALSLFGWDDYDHMRNGVEASHEFGAPINGFEQQTQVPIALHELGSRTEDLADFAHEYATDPEFKRICKENDLSSHSFSRVSKEIKEEAVRLASSGIAEDFPKRTQAMVDTLLRVKAWKEEASHSGKVFLIAGALHLNEVLSVPLCDSRYSLRPLYEMLSTLPAVVLEPKSSMDDQLTKEAMAAQALALRLHFSLEQAAAVDSYEFWRDIPDMRTWSMPPLYDDKGFLCIEEVD